MNLTRRALLRGAFIGAAASLLSNLCRSLAFASNCTGSPIYFDDYKLIVHRGCDGGDTAQREGWYWFGRWIMQLIFDEPNVLPRDLNFDQILERLDPVNDGKFRRHPKYPADDKDWGLSRDQMTPLIAAMGVWGKS